MRCAGPALFLAVLVTAPCGAAESLFGDPVLVRAKSFELRESDLQEAFIALKAARAAIGKPVPPAADRAIREQVLEKLIATRLILVRATPQDREEATKIAQELIAESKARSPSEASYRRQLLAVGTTPEKYEADLLEQAIVKAVLNRELKNKQVISQEAILKFYEENKQLFQEPEKARVAHILFPTRKIPSGEPISFQEKEAKRAEAKRVLERAKTTDDFQRLIVAFSQEPQTGDKRGEVLVVKGGNTAPPSFEVAAFSLQPGQVSDIVESAFGYHILKLIEKIPGTTTPLEKVQDRIRDLLQEQAVQEKLAGYIEELKKEAGVEVLAE